ncbi:Putative thioredoxin 2 [Streptomyces sp. enrichment culture]|jgi:thioredoxin 1|uniref:thioredoxin n=1 Tax=Streptomyces xiamenensis TaxID=408015 RepID=UPI0036EB07E8
MTTIELTKDNFEEQVASKGIAFVDFWASWCGPCRKFAPVFEEAAGRHDDIMFGKVDTEAQQELAQAFQITSIPTLMAIRDNVVLYSQPGAIPGTALEELIAKVREVDMAEVHQKLAEQQAAEEGAQQPGQGPAA